jgi:RNA polymerase sigma-70 factor (ECF subfamily)
MVFIKAWEKLPVASKQKEIQNIRAWIYRIAHNSVVDFYRTNKPATPLEQLNIIRDDSPGPEAVIQENEADLHLAQTISLLDGNLRQVIILRFVNRLSHEEVAQIMGLSESHVRVLQYRALKKMRNQLLERNGHDE